MAAQPHGEATIIGMISIVGMILIHECECDLRLITNELLTASALAVTRLSTWPRYSGDDAMRIVHLGIADFEDMIQDSEAAFNGEDRGEHIGFISLELMHRH